MIDKIKNLFNPPPSDPFTDGINKYRKKRLEVHQEMMLKTTESTMMLEMLLKVTIDLYIDESKKAKLSFDRYKNYDHLEGSLRSGSDLADEQASLVLLHVFTHHIDKCISLLDKYGYTSETIENALNDNKKRIKELRNYAENFVKQYKENNSDNNG